jgi:uncharacterized protein (TIGR00266 family)
MKMETGSEGGIGGFFARTFSGEGGFQNTYTAEADGIIAFGSSFPGQILPIQIQPGQSFIAQKMAFLASEEGVQMDIHFNQKLGGGFFGGEGFIMQRLSGQGIAFLECDGSLVKYELAPGQSMIVDTGNVLGFTEGVDLDIQKVQGVKNVLFGGEGLFNTKLTGPGTIYLQTMPLATVADVIAAHLPKND